MGVWGIGDNIRHSMPALLRQSIYSRLVGYEDVNDAERLSVDPVSELRFRTLTAHGLTLTPCKRCKPPVLDEPQLTFVK